MRYTGFFSCYLLPVTFSLLPVTCYLFPIPYSLFPIPCYVKSTTCIPHLFEKYYSKAR
ncbi:MULTISPECIES: hypothetical protein [unclassified Moorena]|uniref:hypothetical protein n=1 Tax=unclassified Moorena TaxID=2683338 RepID=UPI0025D53039|nr:MULTISPECIES: hypothetical protein [unclassified Moorena]